MKRITLLSTVILAGASMVVNAQDVGCIAIPSHAGNPTVYPNIPQQVQYTRSNFTSSAVTSSMVDSFTMVISVNGIKRQTFYRNMASPFAGSATETTQGVNPMDWGSLGLSAGSHGLCVKTMLWKSGGNIDVNTSNDETCVTINYSSSNFTYDASVDNLVMSLPSYPAGAHLPIPTFPSEMTFDFINAGSNDLIAGLPLALDMTVGSGSPIALTGSLTTPVSSPGQVALTLTWPGSASLPMTAGAFDICLEITQADDNNTANNETCVTYNMGNPASVEDIDEQVYGDVFFSNNALTMKFNSLAKGMASVELFDIAGKPAGLYSLNLDENKDQSVDLSAASKGIYIANITVNGTLLSYKFMVQ